MNKKFNIFSHIRKWIRELFSDKKEVKVKKSSNEEKNVNSPQVNAGNGNNITVNNNPTYNIYNNPPNKDPITNSKVKLIKTRKRTKREK